MTAVLSPNTQAILLLTAPLIAGMGTAASDLLSPGEYNRLARHLHKLQRQPADLASGTMPELLQACAPIVEESRLQKLLARGFLLSQVVERWQQRAIWVVSRADAEYPLRFKTRLREDAPALLYGCGDRSLLETGGLAVVGSRHVDDALINYSMAIGRLAAYAGKTLVSGGAKGIDQAAMRGAMEAGGKVCGVLADSLEKTAMNREHRNLLLDGQLVLISPYDPSAGFNVGHAMQRNKLIYALADSALVVIADINKGGTWAGAVEQLDKFRFVPVHVRSTGEPSAALDALQKKGARPWPNPQDADEFAEVLKAPVPVELLQTGLSLSLDDESQWADTAPDMGTGTEESSSAHAVKEPPVTAEFVYEAPPDAEKQPLPERSPAEALFATVRATLEQILVVPMKETDVAATLEVSNAQAKAWLQRLVEEGVVEKQKKPAGYIVKQKTLFE